MTTHDPLKLARDARDLLAADVRRCPGSGSDAEGWREGCEDCQRRTSPPADPERVLWMTPPPIIAFWCEAHIPPGHTKE